MGNRKKNKLWSVFTKGRADKKQLLRSKSHCKPKLFVASCWKTLTTAEFHDNSTTNSLVFVLKLGQIWYFRIQTNLLFSQIWSNSEKPNNSVTFAFGEKVNSFEIISDCANGILFSWRDCMNYFTFTDQA